MRMDAIEHRKAIEREGAALADAATGNLDRPVPSCPEWDVAKLVRHTGRVHRWAASHVASPDGDISAGPKPPEGDALVDWYRESVGVLLDELDRHDPDEPCRTFAGEATVAWWLRRQALEVAVHRWDAEHAARAGAASPVEPVLAADGVDEWLRFFVPRFLARRDEPIPAPLVGATVHLHGTDEAAAGEAEWLLRLTADGAEVEDGHAKGDAAVRASTSDLLLAVWHRIPLGGLDVVGDAATAAAVLDLVHVT